MRRAAVFAAVLCCICGCSDSARQDQSDSTLGTGGMAGTLPANGTGGSAVVPATGSGGAGAMPATAMDASTGMPEIEAGIDAGLGDAMAGIDAMMPDGGAPDADGAIDSGPPMFGANVRINDDNGSAQQVEVMIAARPDGLVLAGWVDSRNGTQCAYAVSKDGGATWGKNFLVGSLSAGGFTGDPSVAVDDAGNLYAVCQDYGSTKRILFAWSSDSGDTWTQWTGINSSQDKPWIAAARDGTVFLTWLGSPGGYKRSLDHGQTWENPISLGNLVHGTGIAPATTGLVHIAYNQSSQVHYVRSDDWGETLDMGRDLVNQGTACFEPCSPRSHPIIGTATDPTGQFVAITWASTMPGGDGDDDVWVIVSQDGGDTFSDPIRVNDNTQPSRQFQPWVAVDRHKRVHVVWTDLRNNGQNATYYARMDDPAQGFGPNIEVTDARGNPPSFMGDYKAVAIQGDDVLVAWCDSRNGNGDIYFARAPGAAR